jgi:hypothetical protein
MKRMGVVEHAKSLADHFLEREQLGCTDIPPKRQSPFSSLSALPGLLARIAQRR